MFARLVDLAAESVSTIRSGKVSTDKSVMIIPGPRARPKPFLDGGNHVSRRTLGVIEVKVFRDEAALEAIALNRQADSAARQDLQAGRSSRRR